MAKNAIKEKTRDIKKIYEEVFDNRTLEALHKLNRKRIFDKIDKVISTGKEGNVFRAIKEDTFCAIKIYRIETSSFDNMYKYINGDIRFQKIKRNKQNIVYVWTRKEFKNLKIAEKNQVNVPYPIDYFKNVLVMEYLGTEKPAKILKEDKITNIEDILTQTITNLHNLVYKANLVHADLSEYNMIYFNDKLYFIDLGQAVLTTHPFAKEFYNRDINNLVKYFNKFGYNFTNEKLKEYIKKGTYI